MEVTATETPAAVKYERPPPIFIYGVTNYAEISRYHTANVVDDCIRQKTAKKLILNTKTAD